MTDREKLNQVRENLLNQAGEIQRFLDESEETYFRNFKAEIVSSSRVNVTWESNQEGLFDIEYYRPDQDREWQHSVAKYRELIPIEDLETSIGFNSDVTEVRLRAVKDGEVIETFSTQKKDILWGFWDAWSGSKLIEQGTIGKSMERTVQPITDTGIPAIMHLGNLNRETHQQQRARIDSIASFDTGNVPIVHFIDEPFAYGMTSERLDQLVDYARSKYGNKYKYAYTINLWQLLNINEFPEKFDYVFFQAYPYRDPADTENNSFNIEDTKQALFNELDLRLSQLKSKIKADFWIVAQAFEGTKFRKPPKESFQWYQEWASQNDVSGVLYWKYFSDRVWKGYEDLN